MSSVLTALLFTLCHAQTVRPSLTATAPFLSAYSLKQTNAFSFLTNPAALAPVATLSGGVYGERRFGLQELPFYGAALCVPTSSGQFGFSGSYFGHAAHSEAVVGLAYGRHLGTVVDIGARFNYQALKMAGYGSASALYVEAGGLLRLREQVHLGLQISNPTAARIGKEGEDRLPVVGTVGVGYDVSPQLLVAGEVQQVLQGALSVNAGVQYRFDERLWARAGFRSAFSAYYLGLGFGLKAVWLEATASVHSQLGITPGLLVLFTAKEKEP